MPCEKSMKLSTITAGFRRSGRSLTGAAFYIVPYYNSSLTNC